MASPAWTRVFAGRRVLLTGHTGFKGAWLSLALARLGAEVWGFADSAPRGGLFQAAGLGEVVHDYRGDIRARAALAETLADARPEIVFHLAGQSLVGLGRREPLETFSVNTLGTACLLDALKDTPGVRAAVLATSDKCYGGHTGDRPHRESDPMAGTDPYSASKAAAELVAQGYAGLLDVPLATVRCGNVLGGGDVAADRLLPDCAKALATGAPIRLRMPGARRPWLDVADAVAGYLAVAARLLGGQAGPAQWNLGPTPEACLSAGEIARLAVGAWTGEPSEALSADTAEAIPGESPCLLLDASRARELLGWRPRVEVPVAVTRAMVVYKAQVGGATPAVLRELCAEQLGVWLS